MWLVKHFLLVTVTQLTLCRKCVILYSVELLWLFFVSRNYTGPFSGWRHHCRLLTLFFEQARGVQVGRFPLSFHFVCVFIQLHINVIFVCLCVVMWRNITSKSPVMTSSTSSNALLSNLERHNGSKPLQEWVRKYYSRTFLMAVLSGFKLSFAYNNASLVYTDLSSSSSGNITVTVPNYTAAAYDFIRAFRKGELGRVMLDWPESY